MKPIIRAQALVLLIGFALRAHAADPDWQAQEGVLVLRNGYVISGRITVVHDTLLVATGPGGEVRLPRADVEFLCRTIDDAYLQQRDALPERDLPARLKLAGWCLRNGLPHRAADQLLAASIEYPGDPRIAAAEERLVAMAVARESSNGNAAPNAGSGVAPPLPSPRRLPPELMQQFTMVVQPILLNRCATHTCHGSAGQSDYKLVRPVSGHATTSRMTQRNLQATLAYLDRETPEHSDLLRLAESPHGGVDHAPFQEKQLSQLELLTAWARRAAGPLPETVSTNRGGPKQGLRAVEAEPVEESDSRPVASGPPAPGRATPATFVEKIPVPAADPYDPAEFNQRYHAPRKPE